jgi:hypothetical protein
MSEHVLIWNVHGLNSRARRSALRDLLIQQRASILCLQETKVEHFSVTMINELMGSHVPHGLARPFDSLVLLVAWNLGKERNNRTFEGLQRQPTVLLEQLVQEGNSWLAAGFNALALLLAHAV